ncbi:MAG: alginate export family protein [Planctomycetes bacterium]|nr:alginate export family protein [Planctomycetota bacterium]
MATCALVAGGLPSLRAQSDEGVKSRLADLESKVESLLRENSDLRTKVTVLENDRDNVRSAEEVTLTSEIESLTNGLAYRQDSGSFLEQPSGVSSMYFKGEWRTRVDYRSNTSDLTDFVDDEGLRLDYRFNLGLGFRLTDVASESDSRALHVETYFEIQAAGRASNNTAEDLSPAIVGAGAGQFEARDNELDKVQLYKAWILLENLFGVDDLAVKIGRQELDYGSGLILGTNDFFTGTVHDAIRIDIPLTAEGSNVSFFYAKEGAPDGLVSPGLASGGLLSGRFRATGDEDEMLGLYTEIISESLDPVEIDFYWVYFDAHGAESGVAPVNGTTSADPGVDSFGRAIIGGETHTLGFWIRADDLFTEGLYLGVEFAYQLGDDEAGGDIDAMMIEVTAEYALPFMSDWRGAVFASYYFAEGPDNDSLQGFTPLFISRHQITAPSGRGFSRLGNIDFIPTQNVHVFQIGLKFEPAPQWIMGITYLNAMLNHGSEPFTFVPQGAVYVDDRFLGHEIDLFAQYDHSAQTTFFFNLSVFVPEFDYFFENPLSATNPIQGVGTDVAVGVYTQVRVVF